MQLSRAANTCSGVLACQSATIADLADTNLPWTWQQALTLWLWMTTRCSVELDASCKVDGTTLASPEGSTTFAALTHHVNCSNNCCSAGIDKPASANETHAQCALSQIVHGSNVEKNGTYCAFSKFRSWEWAINILLAQTNIPMTCTFHPCNQAQLPSDTRQGAFTCTTGSTNSEAQVATEAFENVLSTQVYYANNTCMCNTSKSLQGEATSMCSGNGVCNSHVVGVPANYTSSVLTPCANATTVDSLTGLYAETCTSCFNGWSGPGCETHAAVCPPCVTAHTSEACVTGVAGTNGYCVCDAGWEGTRCETPTCKLSSNHLECNGMGQCIMGVCECAPGFTGPACEHQIPTSSTPSPTPPSSTHSITKTSSTSAATSKSTTLKTTIILLAAVVGACVVLLGILGIVLHFVHNKHNMVNIPASQTQSHQRVQTLSS